MLDVLSNALAIDSDSVFFSTASFAGDDPPTAKTLITVGPYSRLKLAIPSKHTSKLYMRKDDNTYLDSPILRRAGGASLPYLRGHELNGSI